MYSVLFAHKAGRRSTPDFRGCASRRIIANFMACMLYGPACRAGRLHKGSLRAASGRTHVGRSRSEAAAQRRPVRVWQIHPHAPALFERTFLCLYQGPACAYVRARLPDNAFLEGLRQYGARVCLGKQSDKTLPARRQAWPQRRRMEHAVCASSVTAAGPFAAAGLSLSLYKIFLAPAPVLGYDGSRHANRKDGRT